MINSKKYNFFVDRSKRLYKITYIDIYFFKWNYIYRYFIIFNYNNN